MADTNPQRVADLLKMECDRVVAELEERIAKDYYGDGPAPTYRATVRDVAARHFPTLAAIVRAPERLRAAIARTRYRLGVRVIGYDPGRPDDEA